MKESTVSLLKFSSIAGQDLRTEFKGGTDFPTDDSKQQSKDLLNQSQSAANVKPAAAATLKPLSVPEVKMPTMPKLGSDVIAQDPLVQYLKKHAEELENNLSNMPRGKEEDPSSCANPYMDPAHAKSVLDEEKDILDELFDEKA